MTHDEARALIADGRAHDEAMRSVPPKCTCDGAAGCEDWCPCAPWLADFREGDVWFEEYRAALLTGYAEALEVVDKQALHITHLVMAHRGKDWFEDVVKLRARIAELEPKP